MGCPRKQSQRKMFLGNDFIKKCKPKKAGAVTKGSKAGKPKAKSQKPQYKIHLGWLLVRVNWLLNLQGPSSGRLYKPSVSGHSTKRWIRAYLLAPFSHHQKFIWQGLGSPAHLPGMWLGTTAAGDTSALKEMPSAVGERCVVGAQDEGLSVGAWGWPESHLWPGWD